jgi:hypothetical protein
MEKREHKIDTTSAVFLFLIIVGVIAMLIFTFHSLSSY